MGLQDDPRVQRLLKKTTIQNLMEGNSGKILEKKKSYLKLKLLENNESAVRPFLEECLNLFCETWGLSTCLRNGVGLCVAHNPKCHAAFYTNRYNACDVNDALVLAKDFIKQLRELELSDGRKKELENTNVG